MAKRIEKLKRANPDLVDEFSLLPWNVLWRFAVASEVDAMDKYLEIGDLLNAQKTGVDDDGNRIIPHGKWLQWVEENCEFERAMASNLMNVASYYQRVGNLPDAPTSIRGLLENIKDAKKEERAADKAEDRTARAAEARTFVAGKDHGVIHGDFREAGDVIKDNSVDFIFTDPPYDRKSVPLYGGLAKFGARVLKPGGSLMCYAGHYAVAEILPLMTEHMHFLWIVACYHEDPPYAQMRHIGVVVRWKPILWFVKGKRGDTGTFVDDLIASQREKDAHEWQQGISLPNYYIDKLTEVGDFVVDPFCGGGTTAVAAKQLGRKWMSFDTNDDSVAISRERIAGVRRQKTKAQ